MLIYVCSLTTCFLVGNSLKKKKDYLPKLISQTSNYVLERITPNKVYQMNGGGPERGRIKKMTLSKRYHQEKYCLCTQYVHSAQNTIFAYIFRIMLARAVACCF